jgi:hypothetical protein
LDSGTLITGARAAVASWVPADGLTRRSILPRTKLRGRVGVAGAVFFGPKKSQ